MRKFIYSCTSDFACFIWLHRVHQKKVKQVLPALVRSHPHQQQQCKTKERTEPNPPMPAEVDRAIKN